MIVITRSKRGMLSLPRYLTSLGGGVEADEQLRRYRSMESAANRLQKEAKGYLDSLRGWRYDGLTMA